MPRKALFTSLVLILLCLGSATAARADTINFDSLPEGTVVTNQFPQATFSSTGGNVIRTFAAGLGSSGPNFICTGPASGDVNCTGEVIVNFTNPVNNLRFLGVGISTVGTAAQIDVFTNGVFNATVALIGNGTQNTADPVILSAFFDVTRIRIYNVTDANGIGYDDFTFDVNAQANPVPEPATMILLGTGLAGIAAKVRRRRTTE